MSQNINSAAITAGLRHIRPLKWGVQSDSCFFILEPDLEETIGASLPADSQSFVGTWHGQFKGKTFVLLKLRDEGGKVAGTVTHTTHLEMDSEGNLTSVDEMNTEDRILETRIEGDKLILKVSNNGNEEDSVQCELTLNKADQGELQMIVSPGEELKPWKVERTARA